MSERAAPYFCPYCSDEDLRPDAADGAGLPPGTWRCTGCSRVFTLRYAGSRGLLDTPTPQALKYEVS